MATDHGQPTQTQLLFERLCQVLTEYRTGVHIPEMALSVLRPTHDGRALIGFINDGERVVYYHFASRTLSSVYFDEHGLRTDETELLARDLQDPSDWVRSHDKEFVWVRRHYRGQVTRLDNMNRERRSIPSQ